MNRELIKSIAINSKVYENVSVNDFLIPLVLVGANGTYLCVDGNVDINYDVELFKKVRQKYNYPNCFLFTFSDDATNDYFYDGKQVSVIEDAYSAFKTCYDFSALYLSGGADRSVSLLLESIGA